MEEGELAEVAVGASDALMHAAPGAPKSRKWLVAIAAVAGAVVVVIAGVAVLSPHAHQAPYFRTTLALPAAGRTPTQAMATVTYPESYSEYGTGWFNGRCSIFGTQMDLFIRGT